MMKGQESLYRVFVLIGLAFGFLHETEGIQCLDANNNAVDWYAIYKNPKLHAHKDKRFQEGLSYFYLDVYTPQWTLAQNSINDTDTAVYNTLRQIYNAKNDSIFYLMYNDESPQSAINGGGHTKGVVAFDSSHGFWLIHTCPKFPGKRSEGYFWKSHDFGQNLLCIMFPYNQLGLIGTQLLYDEPHVYDSDLPSKFATDFPVLELVIKRKSPPGPPWFSVRQLTSLAGQNFWHFAKTGHYGADLYDSLVAPHLKSALLVETWLRSSGTELDSNCSIKYQVMRVNSIQLPDEVDFSETKDHSKWAIAYTHETGSKPVPWICIGDINRMKSQFHRGGGTMCWQQASVWQAFNSSVGKAAWCA